MKKKILFILLLIGGYIYTLYDVYAEENYSSYKVGDKIEVHLNNQQKGEFYVTANSDSNTEDVVAIYTGSLGDIVELAVGMNRNECLFEKSNIYTELMNRTSNWTNIKSVTLPTASEVLGQHFDETELSNFRDISASYGGDGTKVKLDGISTVSFYALNIKDSYWTSSFSPTPADESDIDWSDSYPCLPYCYGRYLLNSGSYLVASRKALSAEIRPLITVSKNNIVKPDFAIATPTTSNKGSQIVKVANTAAGTAILIFVVGALLLGSGSCIIYIVLKKNKVKESVK